MGEHLIEASGKLCLLDSMLTFLHKGFADVLFGGTKPGGLVRHCCNAALNHQSHIRL